MKQKKYLHKRIPTSSTSYQKMLQVELGKLKHRLKFTFHEYMKQMPMAMQEAYDMDSELMRQLNCVLLCLRNSKKEIVAHLLIDREYYLTSYKASDRDDLDYMLESIRHNFIIPMEGFINGKQEV